MKDLSTQQITLSSSDYDLRITNLARFIYKKLPVKTGKLIDIGAGNGLFLKFFKDKGFEVEGVELEKDQVHQMQQDYKLKGVKIQQGDITKLRGNESFDFVIASDVIEHIGNDEMALKNLWSYVTDGGYLIVTVPAHQHLYGKRDVKWGHYRRYDKKELVNKLIKLKGSKIASVAFWNSAGYFAYFLYEKILHRSIAESFRYKESFLSSMFRTILDLELRIEEFVGGVPVGLTLVAIVKKI